MRNNRSNNHFYAITSMVVKRLLMFFSVQPLVAKVRVYEKPRKLPANGVKVVGIMPDLHGVADKTHGYELLYDQKVINPGLAGTTGTLTNSLTLEGLIRIQNLKKYEKKQRNFIRWLN